MEGTRLRRGIRLSAARSREGVVPKAENASRCSRSKNEPRHGDLFDRLLIWADPTPVGIGNAMYRLFTYEGAEKDSGERKARAI